MSSRDDDTQECSETLQRFQDGPGSGKGRGGCKWHGGKPETFKKRPRKSTTTAKMRLSLSIGILGQCNALMYR